MKTLTTKAFILSISCLVFTLRLIAQENYNALEFIENKGQWEERVNFKGVLSNGAFFIRKTGLTVVQHNKEDLARLSESAHGKTDTGKVSSNHPKTGKPGPEEKQLLRSHAYTMDFAGANQNAVIVPDKPLPTYNNYYIGNDPSKWMGECRLFQAITYKNIYPGIDVRYYSESGNVKYEFIVSPGADPGLIAMKFDGVDKLNISNNELIITTSVGQIKELYPYTYQYEGTERKKVDCRYQLDGNTVRFNIKNYSRNHTLIIDPILIFASFAGSTADNWGYTATYGSNGTFFAGGIVFETGFPASPGAFQTKYVASGTSETSFWNMGIIKFSSNGSQRLFATYIGGSNKDQPHSLFADPQGNLVIAGRTTSPNYPTTANGSFGPQGGWDIVITKLNALGTGLIGSVRIGGAGDDGYNTADSHSSGPRGLITNYGDDARSEVILDATGNIYVTSCTQSNNFFTTSNAVQRTFGGVQDAVLIKANASCTGVTYSSYLGGSNYDAGFVLALNPSNDDIYMAGATMSADFPGNKSGTYQSTHNGNSDGFVAVLSNDATVYKQCTFMGTPGIDVVFGIQFDRNSFAYIMGTTTGRWPVVSIGSSFYSNPNSKQFISKLKKDLSGFEYSTVFGTGSANPNISPVAFLVDRCENIYVSGWGKDIIGKYQLDPIAAMPITPDALKKIPDESDFYFIVLQRNASKLLYGTFYGQNGGLGEHVDGGTSRFDQNGVIYQGICACSGGGNGNTRPQWPVTPGAWCCASGYSPSSTGAQCNLAALKISFNYAGVASGVRAFINGAYDSTGCVPLTVTLRDTVLNAQSYEWNFGDGTPDFATNRFDVSHTYVAVGDYRIRLIAIDSTTCNIRDTSYITILVRDDKATIDFNAVKLPPCESLSYRFDNISGAPATKPFGGLSFIWDFGDGTRVVSGPGSVNHTFRAAGTYKVRLVLNDTNYCNAPDSLERELRISPLVKAQFTTTPSGCAPYNAVFRNTSLAGQTFVWDFGDGTTSNAINPTHVFANPGTYVIRLKAFDPATCNLEDSTQLTISVQSGPTAAFTVNPTVPVENTPHIFINNSSQNAIRFKWIFGDGDTLLTTSRANVEHQYNATGTFNACLVAFSQIGCTDTVCTPVKTLVVPRLDVPNAFTPLGPLQASRIYIRGFAIGKMKFSIYNRLGQKVFESTDINQGWDGRFKNVVQPMDVYAYTLDIIFTDGTKTTKKGDITLIR
ncbi:MAG: PKD domain-containing protein [Chitinophagaceae bacterium]